MYPRLSAYVNLIPRRFPWPQDSKAWTPPGECAWPQVGLGFSLSWLRFDQGCGEGRHDWGKTEILLLSTYRGPGTILLSYQIRPLGLLRWREDHFGQSMPMGSSAPTAPILLPLLQQPGNLGVGRRWWRWALCSHASVASSGSRVLFECSLSRHCMLETQKSTQLSKLHRKSVGKILIYQRTLHFRTRNLWEIFE